MVQTRVSMMLLVALTLSLAAPAAAQPLSGPEFIGIQPCRLADTRPGFGFSGPFGPPALVGGSTRNFPIAGQCGIPATATAVAFNFTITQPAGAGWLTVWPAGGLVPATSIVNYVANEVVANASDVLLGAGGAISVQSVAMTHLVIDVYGYFTDVEELGNGNTALGDRALFSNTTGHDNTATGVRALESNTTGSFHTAMGFQALLSNTTGVQNTATGSFALSNNTTGSFNTATGPAALFDNTTGNANIATGHSALRFNTTGNENTATGVNALFFNTTGSNNTATGLNALGHNDTGTDNTAMGYQALGGDFTTGSNNTAIGSRAGANLTTGNNNIHIANAGTAADSALIRIGSDQVATFIAGISGVVTPNAATVLINTATGQLGTLVSSRRVKSDIHDLGDHSRALHQLRPVSFRYRSHPPDGSLEYGLIAEEVAEIYPELVVRDTDGQPTGVRYHVLPAMLLNEVQRQQRDWKARFATQQREIDELRAQVRALIDGRKAAAQQ